MLQFQLENDVMDVDSVRFLENGEMSTKTNNNRNRAKQINDDLSVTFNKPKAHVEGKRKTRNKNPRNDDENKLSSSDDDNDDDDNTMKIVPQSGIKNTTDGQKPRPRRDDSRRIGKPNSSKRQTRRANVGVGNRPLEWRNQKKRSNQEKARGRIVDEQNRREPVYEPIDPEIMERLVGNLLFNHIPSNLIGLDTGVTGLYEYQLDSDGFQEYDERNFGPDVVTSSTNTSVWDKIRINQMNDNNSSNNNSSCNNNSSSQTGQSLNVQNANNIPPQNTSSIVPRVDLAKPSQIDANKNGEDLNECIICRTNPRTRAILPCGHANFCGPCTTTGWFDFEKPCPVCRAPIGQVIKIIL